MVKLTITVPEEILKSARRRALDAGAALEAVSVFAEFPMVQIDSELIVSAIHRSRKIRFPFGTP